MKKVDRAMVEGFKQEIRLLRRALKTKTPLVDTDEMKEMKERVRQIEKVAKRPSVEEIKKLTPWLDEYETVLAEYEIKMGKLVKFNEAKAVGSGLLGYVTGGLVGVGMLFAGVLSSAHYVAKILLVFGSAMVGSMVGIMLTCPSKNSIWEEIQKDLMPLFGTKKYRKKMLKLVEKTRELLN